MKTMIVDGITCEMSDTAIQVVTRALDAAKGNLENLKKANEEEQKKAKDALDTANAAVAKLTTEAQTKDAEIVTLKKQVADAELTPAKLDALVKDRAVVADKAKSLLSTVVVDGKSVNEIKRQVVDAKLGDAAKSWTDEQVSISFDTLTVGVNVQTNDGVVRTAQAFSGQPTAQTIADRNGRYDNYDKKLGEAWRKPASAA
jgi:hypothetical protein